jgi:hypothetical protein
MDMGLGSIPVLTIFRRVSISSSGIAHSFPPKLTILFTVPITWMAGVREQLLRQKIYPGNNGWLIILVLSDHWQLCHFLFMLRCDLDSKPKFHFRIKHAEHLSMQCVIIFRVMQGAMRLRKAGLRHRESHALRILLGGAFNAIGKLPVKIPLLVKPSLNPGLQYVFPVACPIDASLIDAKRTSPGQQQDLF